MCCTVQQQGEGSLSGAHADHSPLLETWRQDSVQDMAKLAKEPAKARTMLCPRTGPKS